MYVYVNVSRDANRIRSSCFTFCGSSRRVMPANAIDDAPLALFSPLPPGKKRSMPEEKEEEENDEDDSPPSRSRAMYATRRQRRGSRRSGRRRTKTFSEMRSRRLPLSLFLSTVAHGFPSFTYACMHACLYNMEEPSLLSIHSDVLIA